MNNKKRVIVWRVIQNCNMRCQFCSYSNDVDRIRSRADPSDVKRLIQVLGEYKQKTGEDILISWIGGEPFLWDEIMSFSRMLSVKYHIDVSATTNGLLLSDDKVRSRIIRYFSEIVFSMDGLRECNDRVRKHPGHFDIVKRNIEALDRERKAQGSKLVIKVNTILMRHNIHQFVELCSMLADIGVDEVTFNQLGGYDRPEFFNDNRLKPDQVKSFHDRLPEIKRKYAEKGLIIHGSEMYMDRIIKSTEDRVNSIDECNSCSWFWFINENGYISPCSYTSYEYRYDIRTIKSADDIPKVENYFRELRKTCRSHWCNDCYCTQVYDKFE